MDEPYLITAAQNGDLDAFNRLVLAYQDMAYNLAYRMLANPDSAADAAQTAFISAYRALNTYRGGSFRAWVLRMVTNSCYDELRRQKRHPAAPLEPLDESGEDEIESPRWMASDDPSPEEEMEQRELEMAVQDCLQRLPDEFRVAVVMIDVQGMDYQEVSSAAGVPLGTIKSRLARGRLRLRDCLQRFGELLPAKFRLIHEVP